MGRSKLALKPVTLSAAVTLTLRPLISSQMSDKLVSLFLINIFSVPALVYHLNVLSPEVKTYFLVLSYYYITLSSYKTFNIYLQCISSFITNNLFARSLELLNSEQNLRIVFNALEGSYALCLLANLIQLANIEKKEVLRELCFPSFTVSCVRNLFHIYRNSCKFIYNLQYSANALVRCDKNVRSMSTICGRKTE